MAVNFFDIAYGFGMGVAAPFWIVRSKTRKKVLDAFSQRMGHVAPRAAEGPAVMIHAVSVGELNAARGLIDALQQQRPGLHVIVSTTTGTGQDRAFQLYGNRPDVTLIQYPLDFSAAVSRVLDTLKPAMVILMELELWPNFIASCHRRGIPVVLANGRITETSFTGYRIGSVITSRMMSRLSVICAQAQTYAERFIALGADATKTIVTGTMKFDTAPQEGVVSGADELAAEMNLRSPLWVCGSTGPGEEQIALNAHKTLLEEFPDLQLAIIPRKPKRFDEVANLIVGNGFLVVRRSGQGKEGVGPLGLGLGDDASQSPKPQGQIPVVLGDTMGELRKFYARADVVFVGRSLVDLGEKQHGSDMIEPAALAKPTIVGPFTGNFAEVMNAFEAASAMIRITPPEEDPAAASALLAEAVGKLLRDPGDLGTKARDVVQANVGATARTMEQIIPLLPAN